VLVFHRTSKETQGESVLVETIVRPHGFVAAAHVHRLQTERFEVLEGTLGLKIGDEEIVARPGDVAVVAPGTAHRFWNAGESEARFLCEVRPAFQFESLIETMFTLAAEGQTNRKEMPNPLRPGGLSAPSLDVRRSREESAEWRRTSTGTSLWESMSSTTGGTDAYSGRGSSPRALPLESGSTKPAILPDSVSSTRPGTSRPSRNS
jgi:quercetin dioxygenase-like cupin family protein